MRKFHLEVPGPFAIIVQIFSGAVVGLLIAGVYLALKPVKVQDAKAAAADASAATTERNIVVYIPGNPGHPSGQQWRQREGAFLNKASGGVAMSEQDINRWIATTYGSIDRRVEIKSYDFTMNPAPALCRLDGDAVELGIEFHCSVGKAKKTVVAQARGHFEKLDGQHVFVPTSVHLGSCPLPGLLGTLLVDKLGATYPVPDDVAASWKAVTNAKVEASRLKLAFN